jgi:hypothetical protein
LVGLVPPPMSRAPGYSDRACTKKRGVN